MAASQKADLAGGAVSGALAGAFFGGPVGAVIGAGVGVGLAGATTQKSEAELVSSTVAAVRLCPGAYEERNGVTYFALDVIPAQGGQPWRLMKRYNDFFVLRATMKHASSLALSLAEHPWTGAQFPRKHTFGCKGIKLEMRRSKLEAWLQNVIKKGNQQWEHSLYYFLGCHERERYLPQQVAVTAAQVPQVQVVTPATPVLQAQPAPVPQPVVATEPCGQVMLVTVPPGVSEGQLVAVIGPSGQQLQVPVPVGAVAGSVLKVTLDSTNTTVMHVSC